MSRADRIVRRELWRRGQEAEKIRASFHGFEVAIGNRRPLVDAAGKERPDPRLDPGPTFSTKPPITALPVGREVETIDIGDRIGVRYQCAVPPKAEQPWPDDLKPRPPKVPTSLFFFPAHYAIRGTLNLAPLALRQLAAWGAESGCSPKASAFVGIRLDRLEHRRAQRARRAVRNARKARRGFA